MSFQYFGVKIIAYRRALLGRAAACLLASAFGIAGIACTPSFGAGWQTAQNHPTAFAPVHPGIISSHPGSTLTIIAGSSGTGNTGSTIGTGSLNIIGSSGTGSITGITNIGATGGFASSPSASSITAAGLIISSGSITGTSVILNVNTITNLTATGGSNLSIVPANVGPPGGIGATGGHSAGVTAISPVTQPQSSAASSAALPAGISGLVNILLNAAINDAAMTGLTNSTNLTLAANGPFSQSRGDFVSWKKPAKEEVVSIDRPDAPQPERRKKFELEPGEVIIDTDSD